jgi:hypothetical protein
VFHVWTYASDINADAAVPRASLSVSFADFLFELQRVLFHYFSSMCITSFWLLSFIPESVFSLIFPDDLKVYRVVKSFSECLLLQ